jgi:hypothetical protein
MDRGDELVGGVLMTGMVGYDMAFWRDKCVTGIVQRREEACVCTCHSSGTAIYQHAFFFFPMFQKCIDSDLFEQ